MDGVSDWDWFVFMLEFFWPYLVPMLLVMGVGGFLLGFLLGRSRGRRLPFAGSPAR